jgi:hypothetical protein
VEADARFLVCTLTKWSLLIGLLVLSNGPLPLRRLIFLHEGMVVRTGTSQEL